MCVLRGLQAIEHAQPHMVPGIDQRRVALDPHLADLLRQMRTVSAQSETAEPLLSRKLYDAVRETQTEQIDESLRKTSELLRRSFLPEAQKSEQPASAGIRRLRENVEKALPGLVDTLRPYLDE